MGRLCIPAILCVLAACAAVTPAHWQKYDADFQTVEAAVQKALAEQGMGVALADGEQVLSHWNLTNDGVDEFRERFRVRWRTEDDGKVTVSVQHERQKRAVGADGRFKWGTPQANRARQEELIDRLSELLPAAGGDGSPQGEKDS